MDVRHSIISLNDETASSVVPDLNIDIKYDLSFTVQNLSESDAVLLGGSDVAWNSYGIKLAAGAVASFQGVQRNFQLYGLCPEGISASVAVLRVSM